MGVKCRDRRKWSGPGDRLRVRQGVVETRQASGLRSTSLGAEIQDPIYIVLSKILRGVGLSIRLKRSGLAWKYSRARPRAGKPHTAALASTRCSVRGGRTRSVPPSAGHSAQTSL